MHMSTRSQCLLRLVATLFVFAIFMRVLFAVIFWGEANPFETLHFLKAAYLGIKFDLRVTLVLCLPLALLFWIPVFDPFKNSKSRKFWRSFYTFVGFAALGVYVIDIAYFRYLHGRVNATALDFMSTPWISLKMVWQTYPVIWLFLMGFVFAAGLYWLIGKYIFTTGTPKILPFKKKWFAGTLITLFFIVGLYGKLSQYPLRWSEAYFSNNTYIAGLGLNPIHHFVDTLKNRGKAFDVKKTKKAYSLMSEYLDVENPDPEKMHFRRPIKLGGPAKIDPNNPPNVVVIVLESLAAYKTGALGHPLKPTPYLDEVAQKGILFTEFYVPSEATARSIYCLVTGIADVNPSSSTSSRNPLIVDQNTVANAFKGYEKYYFIGGSANWGNIRGVITNNIEDVNMVEEADFESEKTDVWGISDLHLFREAHQKLSKRQDSRPFLAFIQSAGFHRPYTIPKDKGQFQLKSLSDKEMTKHGFLSNEEYNSLRFQDYSFGEFYQLTKDDPAFKNTIFLITGDHGLPSYQAEHLGKGNKIFDLERWHVPLVIYGPGLIEPAIDNEIATEPDILPTLAGMTGHNFTNTTLGRNLFTRDPKKSKYAFNYAYYQNPPQIGLLGKEFYATGLPGKIKGLFKYRSNTPNKDVASQYPEKWKEMEALANGFYESSRYMLHHNRK